MSARSRRRPRVNASLTRRPYDSSFDSFPNHEELHLLSRIRIFALLATIAALGVAFAACGGSSDSGSSEDPQKVIDEATLEGVESGEVELKLNVNAEGEEGGKVNVALSGPFQAGAKGELPEADMEISAKGDAGGQDIDFEGGVTLLPDRAYIGYEGSEYEVDPTTFGFVKSGFEQAEQESQGEGAEGEACQEAAAGLEISDFIEDLKNEGGVDVNGTQTTKISGNLDVGGAIDQIIKLTENPACAKQFEAAGPLPLGELEKAKTELTKAVKTAHAEVYVGEDDGIVRKLVADLTVEPEGSNEKVELEFELTLSGVNEKQTISAPANAKPLEELFEQLGVNPLELLQGVQSGGGIGGLLEGVEGGSMGGTSSEGSESTPEGGSLSEGIPSGKQSQAFLKCLQGAETPTEIQKCASLMQ